MTGFGQGEARDGDSLWTAEVRSVNHRFLDLRISLPRAYIVLEDRVRKLVTAYHDRGRVEINIVQLGNLSREFVLTTDLELVNQYYNCLVQIKKVLAIDEPVSLQNMLTLRDVIGQKEQNPDIDVEWKVISKALIVAMEECKRMREQEGEALRKELSQRLQIFSSQLKAIEDHTIDIVKQRQEDLKTRIGRLLDGINVDPARLAQEAAILADKSDITEEIVRLKSHISQFYDFLKSYEPIGRRLDFLLQEFLREVNTIASKINNSKIAHYTVEMKNEVEKLREQVQNIE